MGIFDKSTKVTGTSHYDQVKSGVVARDGNVHVLMFNTFCKVGLPTFALDTENTIAVDEVVTGLQKAGHELVDLKLQPVGKLGFTEEGTQFHVVLLYR